jgi:hypothetical protein
MPVELKNALNLADVVNKGKLTIIGLDACSMSMVEIAYELHGLAKFMVASQEEVPDTSFSYRSLVDRFRKGKVAEELCREVVVDYAKAYQEYFFSEATAMHPVTLAAIDLTRMEKLKEPLRQLAAALLSAARKNSESAKAIYFARQNSQSFVGGLFVDLHDFCDKLGQKVQDLKAVCRKVSEAIDDVVSAHAGVVDGRVLESGDPKLLSHGLSIYFPYLKDGSEKQYLDQKLVKGIPRMIDKDNELVTGYQQLNSVVASIRYSVRRQMIKDIEGYYQGKSFEFAQATEWYQFIQRGWSRILASQILASRKPVNIDTVYLAQQCVQNLLKIIDDAPPPPSGGAGGGDDMRGISSQALVKPNGHSISPVT